MKNNTLRFWPAIAALVFIAGCSLPSSEGSGPRVWIDNPLNGDTLALAPVVVQSHASSVRGTTSAALLVNGAQVRMDNAENPLESLTSFTQSWTPTASGDYTLEVDATDVRGNTGRSNRVVIHINALLAPPSGATLEPLPVISSPPTVTPTPQVTLAITPSVITYLNPTFIFTINANCRQGPGTGYEAVTIFMENEKVTIEGRNADSSWYWVLIPNSISHCWVSASTGSPYGPLSGVAVVPFVPPVEPGSFTVSTKSCTSLEYIVTLQWSDVANELGYRIYRGDTLIATLPFNTTTYNDPSPDNNPHSYQVQAYNDAGSANSPKQDSSGCVY